MGDEWAMMFEAVMQRTGTLGVTAFLLAAGLAMTTDARAAGTAWEDPAEVRILDGGLLEDGETRLAGLEILLDPGWKTYWRNPGDSGIPPTLDFTGSDNLGTVAIEYPAPELFWDGYAWSLGYSDAVVFPLIVSAADPAKPVELKIAMQYGVCKDVCIPAEAAAAMMLDGSKARRSGIDFYRARVPERIADGAGTSVTHTNVDHGGDVPVLEIHLGLPGAEKDAFAVVEGPEGWYLPVPERAGQSAEGAKIYRMPLDGAPEGAVLSGAELRITGVSPTYAFEQSITLD